MKCGFCSGRGEVGQGTTRRCPACGGTGRDIRDGPTDDDFASAFLNVHTRGGQSAKPRQGVLFWLGVLIFVGGVVGGFLFVAVVGRRSPEFRAGFGYFIAAYVVGMGLMAVGRRR